MDTDYGRNLDRDDVPTKAFEPSLFVWVTVMSRPAADRAKMPPIERPRDHPSWWCKFYLTFGGPDKAAHDRMAVVMAQASDDAPGRLSAR